MPESAMPTMSAARVMPSDDHDEDHAPADDHDEDHAPGVGSAESEPELREILADRHRRCLPGLARMRTLTRADDGVPVVPYVAAELGLAMREVLAELGAAERALVDSLAGTLRGGSVAGFLTVRLRRLDVVAEAVLAAAEAGDAPALRRRLSQFHALASAMWQVQRSVQPPSRDR